MATAISEQCLTGQTDSHIHYFNERLGIHKDLLKPWQQMQQAARADGIEIDIASGFRSFARQQQIFDNKMTGNAKVFDLSNNLVEMSKLSTYEKIHSILLFSALPGASRHHWGTDIDVYSKQLLADAPLALENWEYGADGPMAPLTQWLNKNMHKFGFFRPYDKYRGGIAKEPWHISYQPLAQQFQQQLNCDIIASSLINSSVVEKTGIIAMLNDIYSQFISNIGKY